MKGFSRNGFGGGRTVGCIGTLPRTGMFDSGPIVLPSRGFLVEGVWDFVSTSLFVPLCSFVGIGSRGFVVFLLLIVSVLLLIGWNDSGTEFLWFILDFLGMALVSLL